MTFACQECGKEFARKGGLKRHTDAIHGDVRYACEECGKEFSQKDNLKRHEDSQHNNIRFSCDECPAEFTESSNLKTHMDQVHRGIRYECKECGNDFTSQSYLKTHLGSVHGDIRYPCQECERAFTTKNSLQKHLDSVHGDVRYTCEECRKDFTDKFNLKKHINSIHGDAMRYPCNECDRDFSSKGNLKRHMESFHQNVRHTCEECGEEFTEKQSLKRHMNSSHRGIKYPCSSCDRSFLSKTKLTKHERLEHTRCSRCNMEGLSSKYEKESLCLFCGHDLHGIDPVTRREDIVFQALQEEYGWKYELILDRPDEEAKKCGIRFRPDIYFSGVEHRKIIVEVDESQHKGASYQCLASRISDKVSMMTRRESQQLKENDRMSVIASTGDVLPTVFIRFNPDAWKNEQNKRPSLPLKDRIKILKREVCKWLDVETKQEHFVTVVYLYYDGSWRREEFIPVSPEEYPLYSKLLQERFK